MHKAARLLTSAALGTAAIGLGPVTAQADVTPQASAPHPAAVLTVTHITCIEQEDYNGADDAYLVVGGATIWGPVQMLKGDSKDLRATFNSGQVLTLMEGDWPDADDNLGAKWIDGPGVYQFNDDGANYWVTIS